MTPAFITDLGRQTLRDPRAAAARLLGLQLPAGWLWMALALMTALNAIIYSLSLQLTRQDRSDGAELFPPVLQSPIGFALFLGGGLVATVLALTWMGRLMGGKAQIADVLVLITWLQVLRLAVQLVVLVLMLALPSLVGPVVIGASVWGLVILVIFLDCAHRFGSWGKATVMLVLASVAMVVALSLILGLIGVTVMEGV